MLTIFFFLLSQYIFIDILVSLAGCQSGNWSTNIGPPSFLNGTSKDTGEGGKVSISFFSLQSKFYVLGPVTLRDFFIATPRGTWLCTHTPILVVW